jgi:hypothetical protein
MIKRKVIIGKVPKFSKPEVWIDSKKLKEVTDEFKNKFNINLTFDKLKTGIERAEILEAANEIGKEYTRIFKKNFILRDLLQKRPLNLKLYSMAELPGTIMRWGEYNRVRSEIKLAIKGRLQGRLKIGKRSWSVDESIVGSARHELGHHLYYIVEKNIEWDKIYELRKAVFWRNNLSTYGASNSHEGFAELFSSMTHKSYRFDKYKGLCAKEQRLLLDLLGGKKRKVIRPKKLGIKGPLDFLAKRVERAKRTHVPHSREAHIIAINNEKKLAIKLKGKQLLDNEPFDVIVGPKNDPSVLIEVKTIIKGKNDKITMHPDALMRKKNFAKKFPNADMCTVVFDERSGIYYLKEGVGSFRLTTMKSYDSIEALIKDIKKMRKK